MLVLHVSENDLCCRSGTCDGGLSVPGNPSSSLPDLPSIHSLDEADFAPKLCFAFFES
jgi:hypothetical protein